MKTEIGPVVVPSEWDYAAASMRKPEKIKMRSCEVERVEVLRFYKKANIE